MIAASLDVRKRTIEGAYEAGQRERQYCGARALESAAAGELSETSGKNKRTTLKVVDWIDRAQEEEKQGSARG